jgi:hypothetical protein
MLGYPHDGRCLIKILKITGTVLLGGLLFFLLVFLGVAFTVQHTLLDPDFVVNHAEKIDLPTVATDIIDKEIGDQNTPEEELIVQAVSRVISDLEPQLKEQLAVSIRSGYDYLLGRSDRLSIVLHLADLKQDLKDSLWQTFSEDPGAWLPLFQDQLNAYIDQNFMSLVQGIRSHLPPPLAILPIESLRSPLQDYLLQIEGQIIRGEMPPAALDLVLTVARVYFDDYYDDIVADIPDEYAIDSQTLPADAVSTLEQVRQGIGYFQTGYYLLIVFAVLLAGGVVLIHRNVRVPCLVLGIVLAAAGAVDLAGFLLAGNYPLSGLMTDVPASLGLFIDGFYRDVLSVGRLFAIVVLAVGAALLALSIFYPRRDALD